MKNFQKKINIDFTDSQLLKTAFTHRSFLNENKWVNRHNERLEFLWDAVLELSVTTFLFKHFDLSQEWYLTSVRSALVRKENLSKVSRNLDLWKLILLSKWEEMTWWRDNDYLLANTIEAIIWAIYLDKGFKYADKFINKYIISELDAVLDNKTHVNSKSTIQSYAQSNFKLTPWYTVLDEYWPDHEKTFVAWIMFNEVCVWVWIWSNKQTAQEDAASKVCKAFNLN